MMSTQHRPRRPGDERVPLVGTLVLPQLGPDAQETIIGIVTDDAVGNNVMEVLWISDARGVFICHEAIRDLTIAVLGEIYDHTDLLVNHYALGNVLALHLGGEYRNQGRS